MDTNGARIHRPIHRPPPLGSPGIPFINTEPHAESSLSDRAVHICAHPPNYRKCSSYLPYIHTLPKTGKSYLAEFKWRQKSFGSSSSSSPIAFFHGSAMATSARPSRRATLANVDYAVLTSGMQIPEFSSEEEASDDESWGAKRRRRPAPAAAKRRRRDTEASASSPSLSGSAGDLGSAGDSPAAVPNRRPAAKPKSCFVCRKPTGRGGVSQCDICARW
jgi:hypothetical protein